MIQFFNKKMSKKRKGFTLIELVVVIAILGILVALAIPRFTGIQETARQNADKATHQAITSAINVAVANGDITDDVIVTAAATTGLLSDDSGIDLLQPGAAVKSSANFGTTAATYTWAVLDGEVTPPVISGDGAWTAD